MLKTALTILTLLWFSMVTYADQETSKYPDVLNMQSRAALKDMWLEERLNTVMPQLMRENGVDMWVLIAREYNEDPVAKTMLPATWLSARRRTILMFYDTGSEIERLAVSRYSVGRFFKAAWNPEEEPDQWKRLSDLINKRDPKKIVINASDTFALADGITHSQHTGLMNALGPTLQSRVVTDPAMAIGWLERRTQSEMNIYPDIVGLAHAIIHEGMSSKVITPNTTTTADLMWWFRDTIRQKGVTAWFHPTVSIQRQTIDKNGQKMTELFDPEKDDVIRHGDLIHLDFGITYIGLNTDTQHHAYILKPGEIDAPAGLKMALKNGNRLQDILTSHFETGASGDNILAATRAQAISEGIEPSVYTHPIGYHGHGAGATIGMWDQQGGVKGRGYYPLVDNTAWSIELSAITPVPEWGGQKVRIMLEEDAFFDGEKVSYIDGRQTYFHLITSK
ncbi:aminopeptidase P family protein [Kordiimonas aquimaris]|uniref:aminopeptidase P family protein n=1 Tax=Kordiimonas aquimaris TaxID=707591 RepID=UPI0021D38D4F|nr:aminopeptidase P family protein [Kordiimonas aquimaris]